MKKKLVFVLFITMLTSPVFSQENRNIYLLVRADDIGSFHAANVACIESFQQGIARSVELMPPCSWFLEAVKMLNENPGFDVGVHLTLTSEWSNVKWRPLTRCPSLVDKDGYFFPMVRKNENFPTNSSIQEANWDLKEIEQELRAQIEVSVEHVTQISHLSIHMGFTGLDPRIESLVNKLADEYKLPVNFGELKRFAGWGKEASFEERTDKFCENLEKLTPGKYLFVEHPAHNVAEMKTVGHKGYENVSEDREWVTRVFTSVKVKKVIQDKGIILVSYKDLKL